MLIYMSGIRKLIYMFWSWLIEIGHELLMTNFCSYCQYRNESRIGGFFLPLLYAFSIPRQESRELCAEFDGAAFTSRV